MPVTASSKLLLAAVVPSLVLGAFALSARADEIPVPGIKPLGFAAGVPAGGITGSVPALSRIAPEKGVLKDGLDALSNREPLKALAIRNSLKDATLDRHILTWAIAVSGQSGVPSREIAAAQQELKGWPGLKGLRAHSERALYRENPSAADVLAAFGKTKPETVEGSVILARAHLAKGDRDEAARIIRGLWFGEAMDKAMESRILKEFSGLLQTADHKRRMEMLLYRSRISQAERFSGLGEAQSLYRAFAAVIQRSSTASARIKAVDPSWHKDPSYLFLRIENLRHQDKYKEAARLLSEAPSDKKALIRPGEWWVEQRIVSRGLYDQGDYAGAYRIAANHSAESATDIIEAEFHAGWYALRGLKDPSKASVHFKRILDHSTRPLSASRAWYWLGRAAEAGGPGEASSYFTKAAAYSETFYGQLSAARLGRKSIKVAYPSPTAADRQNFETHEAVRAIARLEETGHGWRADSLYRALAGQITSPGELAILAARAEKARGHQLSLQIGKLAAGRGIDVAALAFPTGAIPVGADISGAGKALAYAIARQESAFNPAAISPANAHGLLQILPGTAKGVAGRYGLAYSKEKLTTDAAYNATLGAHFLGEQIESFGGSYILTFIAYNAGPRRVPQWIERYGDPRGLPIDEVVDWIERIPFGETRGYVQRVMENYQIYKSRLGQETDIVRDLRAGRQ